MRCVASRFRSVRGPPVAFFPISRRRWLQTGSAAALATGLPAWFAPGARSIAGTVPVLKPIRSCIVLFSYGGPSQFETYDPKPAAPAEVRGEWGQIATAVPGIEI